MKHTLTSGPPIGLNQSDAVGNERFDLRASDKARYHKNFSAIYWIDPRQV